MALERTARPNRVAWRVFVALIVGASLLSFADRAPMLVRPVVDIIGALWGGAERVSGLDVVDRSDIPFDLDLMGHFVLWLSLAAACWWTFRRRVSGVVQAVGLFTASCLVEIGQMHLTSTRVFDVRDLRANAAGIAAGLALAWLADGTSRAARLVRTRPTPSTRSDESLTPTP